MTDDDVENSPPDDDSFAYDDLPDERLPDVGELCEALNFDDTARLAADVCLEFGFRVLPMPGGRKHALPSRGGAAGAVATREELAAAFADIGGEPDAAALGVVPGSAGLAVVTASGPHAAEAWQLLAGRHPADTASIVTDTPTGGTHYWHALPDSFGDEVASVHTEHLGLKTGDSWVVVVGGRRRRKQARRYAHTAARTDWAPLDAAYFALPDVDAFDGECDTDTAARNIAHMSASATWDDETKSRANADIARILEGDNDFEVYYDREAPETADEGHALIGWLAATADRGEIHLEHALAEARDAWIAKRSEPAEGRIGGLAERWTPEALRIAWDYMVAAHFSASPWAPQRAAPVLRQRVASRDTDWRTPWDRNGALREVPVTRVSRNQAGIAAAIAEAWEINETAVAAALRAAARDASQRGGINTVTTDQVHRAVFGEPAEWRSGQQLAGAVFRDRIAALADFRLAADGTLWRYCHAGPDRGLWDDDGERMLSRLMLRILGNHYTRTHRQMAISLVTDDAEWLQHPSDMSTWQPDDIIFCRSGVIEWQAGGKVRDPQPADNLTVRHPWHWDPAAECPEFDRFMKSTFAPDAVDAVWETCGAALYPRAPWKRAMLLHGPRNSGKSTFLKVLTHLVGEQWVTAMSLMQIADNRFMPANLFGKRVNVCGDISPDAMPDPAIFKQLVGGDEMIQADVKNKSSFPFRNQAKLLFSANELPRTRDFTDAYFDRWLILRCANSVTEGAIDYDLDKRLTAPAEMSGIARKSVDALARLIDQHDYSVPQSSLDELAAYRVDADPILSWARDRLDITGDEAHFLSRDMLRNDNAKWCDENGHKRASSGLLGRRMKPLENEHPGFVWDSRKRFGRNGERVRGALGVRFLPDEPDLIADNEF